MMYDWTGSEGAFYLGNLYVFIFFINGGRIALFPFPTMPDEHPKEDQEDAQDNTGDYPADCTSA